jgi:hypothetical protein
MSTDFAKRVTSLKLEAERDCAKCCSPFRNPKVVKEGQEPDEFWRALGGKTAYATGEGLVVINVYGVTTYCRSASDSRSKPSNTTLSNIERQGLHGH